MFTKLVTDFPTLTLQTLSSYLNSNYTFIVDFGVGDIFHFPVVLTSMRYVEGKGLFFCGVIKCNKKFLNSFDTINFHTEPSYTEETIVNCSSLSKFEALSTSSLYIGIKKSYSHSGPHYVVPVNELKLQNTDLILSSKLKPF